MKKQPNIIFIISEQHNSAVMGCMGDPYIKTPNLDKLAQKSLVLDNCYCNAPLCVPSRSSLLAGRLPQDIRVYNNHQSLHHDIPTVAHSLNIAGYETVLSGRMHFYGPDQYHGYEKHLVGDVTPTYQGEESDGKIWGKLDGSMRQKKTGLQRSGAGCSAAFAFDEDVRDTTVEFLESRTDERPLFLTVGLFCAHPPFICPEERFRYYYNLLPELPVIDNLETIHPAMRAWMENREVPDITREDVRRVRAAYYGMVELMDEMVGTVIDKVNQTMDMENTLIVYTADHGECIGLNNLFWKANFYDASVKVPAMIAVPNGQKGVHEKGLTCLADLTATFVDCGGGMPLPGQYGHSLIGVSKGTERVSLDRSIISQLGAYPRSGDHAAAMIRRGNYKLISYYGYDIPQLFDLENDPEERYDLGSVAEYQDRIRELEAELYQNWDAQKAEKDCQEALENSKVLSKWAKVTKYPIPEHWNSSHAENYLLAEEQQENKGDLL